MAQRITRKVAITTILTYATDNGFDDNDVIEVVNKVIASFDKKPTTKPINKTRVANEGFASKLYEIAKTLDEGFDFHYVINTLDTPEVATPQKVTGIMKCGIEMGLFEKYTDKKRTMYRAIIVEE